jgi:hypothetical protein
MATIHRAGLRPSKVELLSQWIAAQPWAPVSGRWGDSDDAVTVIVVRRR